MYSRFSQRFVRSLLVWLGIALLSGSASGCVSVIRVDGLDVDDEGWRAARYDVAPRAALDLSCDRERLRFTLLQRSEHQLSPTNLAVRGCGRQAVYVRSGITGVWVLDNIAR